MKAVTLLGLSTGPLPKGDIVGAVFVTIWLFFVVGAVIAFRHVFFGKGRDKDPWYQFQNIFFGAIALALWYVLVVVDRWIRYDGHHVKAGYILLQPVSEPLRVASSIFILSGIFQVLWRRESNLHKAWWIANNVMILLVSIVSIFYLMLFLALAVCWLEFTSLNSIRDIADRRSQFELATAALFMGYALLILLLAGQICFQIAKRIDNHKTVDRIIMFGVALSLFARCLMELILTGIVFSPDMQRQDVQLAQDIAYGIITVVSLSLLVYLAWDLGPQHESGGHQRKIDSNIREAILDRLKHETDDGKNLPSPPFSEMLQHVEGEVHRVAGDDPLFANTGMDVTDAKAAAGQLLSRLRAQESWRGARSTGSNGAVYLTPTRGGKLVKQWIAGSSNRSGTESGGPSSIASTRQREPSRVSSAPVVQNRVERSPERRVLSDGVHHPREFSPQSSVMHGQYSPGPESIQMEAMSHRRYVPMSQRVPDQAIQDSRGHWA